MTDINPIDLQKALKDADYPAGREALVSRAKENGAGDDVVQALSGLPQEDFASPTEVQQAVFDSRD